MHLQFGVDLHSSLKSRGQFTAKVMQDKINRYELYFHSQEWHNESWQPKESKYFPSILIITEKYYNISSLAYVFFKLLQLVIS